MSTPEELLSLLSMLQSQQHLLDRGFTFILDGGVLVEKSGHARGLWRITTSGGFSWTPAGYNQPVHRVADAQAAMLYTLSLL